MTTDVAPRVSVGLAVYNGEPYLADSIECILNQTFGDFELIICDNDSSDRTEEICRQFAASDARVRYYRNPKNVGGVRNENRTFYLARGEFFKLAAHDDLISQNFLEVSVAALDRNPAAHLVTPSVVVINDEGNELPTSAPTAGTERAVAERIRGLVDWRYMCEATYGLVRTGSLRAIRPQANFLHSDRIVLCELAARAPFLFEPAAVFYRRLHAGNIFQDWRGRMAWFQPELKRSGRIRMPHWHLLGGYTAMLVRSDLPLRDLPRGALEIARWAVSARRSLVADAVYAARMLTLGSAGRRQRYQGEGRTR